MGKTLVAIVNLPPRKMMGLESYGMLISAVHKENGEEKLHLHHGGRRHSRRRQALLKAKGGARPPFPPPVRQAYCTRGANMIQIF